MTAEEIRAAKELRNVVPLPQRRQNRMLLAGWRGRWFDVGEGECSRCGVVRRLYSPEIDRNIVVCAPCAQISVTSALSGVEAVETDAETVDFDQ